jgi:hypothetical protein
MDAGVWDGADTGFEFGLECLLDGIERRVTAARDT